MTFIQKHAYSIATGIAGVLWPLFPKRRKISVTNILKCGVAKDEREAARIAKAAWCHLAGHIAEAFCVPQVVTAQNWREHLDTSGVDPESMHLLFDKPEEPIIIVSAHHGVWEAATNILSFVRPMIAVARTMNSKLAANWMEKHHFRGRITVIDKNRGFTPEVLEKWKTTNAAMTLLVDQHTSKGPLLKFFGRPAQTFTSATRLAMRCGAPIVIGSFVRVAPYQYKIVHTGKPLRFSKDDDRDACTQLLNDRLEQAIRKYPEQYLWAHRRWRHD